MKKASLPLLCLSLSLSVALCGFTNIPEAEENPNDSMSAILLRVLDI